MAHPSTAHVAAEIRAARSRRRLTQAELAGLAGIHRNTVYRLENEERAITLPQMIALAEALGVHPSQFIPPEFEAAS